MSDQPESVGWSSQLRRYDDTTGPVVHRQRFGVECK